MRGNAVVIAVLATVAVTAAGCGGVTIAVGEPRGDVENYELSGPVDRVVVRADAGSVHLRGSGQGRPPAVTEELHYDGRKPRTSHTVDGDTLMLTASCPSQGQRRCWVDYAITVDGEVEVVAQTGAGDVDVAKVSGSVEVTTEAGDVRATGVAGAPVTASSGAGSVLVEFLEPPTAVDATSSTGDVTVRLPDETSYAVDAGTDLGERTVRVSTDSGSEHEVRARSEVGDVSVLPAS